MFGILKLAAVIADKERTCIRCGVLLFLFSAVFVTARAEPRTFNNSAPGTPPEMQSSLPPQPPGNLSAGDVAAGEALFTGRRRFQNGGPACGSCHNVATLKFPSGGTMAPDLTHEYSKLGPEGMHYALRTLYFPAMNALFLKRQLTDPEERDLAAFFRHADYVQQSNAATGIFGGAAVLGLLMLIGITWISGRGRVHSVRRKLLLRSGLYRENQ